MNKWFSAPLLVATAALVAIAPLQAEDWPAFRGPLRNGIAQAKNLPTEWTAEKNVAWKSPIPGEGWSSPVVVDGRVYLTAAVAVEDGEQGEMTLRLFTLNAKTGEIENDVEVFRQPADSPKIHKKNSHASPTPIIDGDLIYLHFGHQGTACLTLAGKVVWKNESLAYPPVHGNGGSPLLLTDRVVFSRDGAKEPNVTALKRSDGTVAWITARNEEAKKKFAFSTPTVVDVDGQQQVISCGANCVCAYSPEDGKEIWRCRYEGYSIVPRPVVGHGMVFISTSFDSPSVMAIKLGGSGDITDTHVAWSLKKGAPHSASKLLIGDLLYMVSDRGVATCVEAKTGETVWQKRIGGNFSASPVYADGNIYLLNEEGECTVIAEGREFQELSKNDIEERTLASMAVADGALFIRSDKHLYRIE